MKKWRSTPVHNYDKLEELFSKDRATGLTSGTGQEFLEGWNKEVEEENYISIAEDTPYNIAADEEEENEDNGIATPTSMLNGKMGSSSSMIHRAGKRKLESIALQQDTKEKFERLVNAVEKSTEAMIQQGNTEPDEKVYTKKEIFDELIRISVPEDKLIPAFIKLAKDKDNTYILHSSREYVN